MSVNMFGLSAVHKRERTIQTNTPAFIRRESENNTLAEFRELTLKGVLRYWYRAVEQERHYKQLLESEKRLFGGAGNKNEEAGRSLITLSVQNINGQNEESSPLPHRGRGFRTNALQPGSTFHLETAALKQHPYREDYKRTERYIDLMLLLGTFGMRSRRGAGSLQCSNDVPSDKQALQSQLLAIFKDLHKEEVYLPGQYPSQVIRSNHNHLAPDRPQLRTVWIGGGESEGKFVFRKASNAGHLHNEGSLGKIHGGRVASPLIVKSLQIGSEFYPVISEVATNEQVQNPQYSEQKKNFLIELGVNQP